MRIGIDCQVLRQGRATGISNYVSHLIAALQKIKTNHEFVFMNRGDEGDMGSRWGRIPFWSAHVAYARAIHKAELDVFHGPANNLPLFYKGPSVITIHDLAIYKHPEWFPRGQWLATKIIVPASIRKANKIIVPSMATANDLKELFNVPDEKIAVIPHGVETRFFKEPGISNDQFPIPPPASPARQRLKATPMADGQARALRAGNQTSMLQFSKPYILFVGTLEPRKNVSRIVEAYAGLPKDILDKYDLVLAGGRGWNEEMKNVKIKIENDNEKLKNRIKFLDYVDGNDLPSLYQNASLFVYPSLYEGFGLPVLEAMAGGVPVITSNVSSLPEVAGETAFFVDPYSVEEIRDAIASVLIRDLAKLSVISPARLAPGTQVQAGGDAGINRARQFTWERTAEKTMRVYEEAVESGLVK